MAHCAWCGLLTQAHGAKSDKFIRSRMTAEAEPAEAAPVAVPAKPAEQVKKPEPVEEPTIFDMFKGGKKGGSNGKA